MFYPGNRILSVDMGSHTYKYIEAKMKPDIKILRYGFVEKEQLFQADKPAGNGESWAAVPEIPFFLTSTSQ